MHPRTKDQQGRDRKGQQRWKCKDCGVCFTDYLPKPLGDMQVDVGTAKLVLRLLLEGSSVRSAERLTKMHRATICKLIVFFGELCRTFMDAKMKDLELTHLQFDEQWTFVGKNKLASRWTRRPPATMLATCTSGPALTRQRS